MGERPCRLLTVQQGFFCKFGAAQLNTICFNVPIPSGIPVLNLPAAAPATPAAEMVGGATWYCRRTATGAADRIARRWVHSQMWLMPGGLLRDSEDCVAKPPGHCTKTRGVQVAVRNRQDTGSTLLYNRQEMEPVMYGAWGRSSLGPFTVSCPQHAPAKLMFLTGTGTLFAGPSLPQRRRVHLRRR